MRNSSELPLPLSEEMVEAHTAYRARRRREPRSPHLAEYSPNNNNNNNNNRLRQTAVLRRLLDVKSGVKYLNDYRIVRTIGQGACGKVKLGYHPTERRLVAIKEVRRPARRTTLGGHNTEQRQFLALKREATIMKTLRHRNIVSVLEVIDDPEATKLYLIMQYIDGGAIASVSVEDGTDTVCTPIEPHTLVKLTRQMLSGLEYLHRHNVVHRDIKPDNILVSKEGTVYLADFGVAETFDTHFRERLHYMMQESMMYSMAMSRAGNQPGGPQVLGKKGTLLFMAPELWENHKGYGRPIDMWALGVTLYVLLTGTLPFRTTEDITDPRKLHIPTEYGEDWSELLRGLLDYDCEKRLTVKQARAMVKGMVASLDTEAPTTVEAILLKQRQVAVGVHSATRIAEKVRIPNDNNNNNNEEGEVATTVALPSFRPTTDWRGRRPTSGLAALLQEGN